MDQTLAGLMSPHTIDGHDHHLGFTLRPKGSTDGGRKLLGIRLRQESFHPFITIWGTHTQMRDYRPCELTEEVNYCLHACINHTISQ